MVSYINSFSIRCGTIGVLLTPHVQTRCRTIGVLQTPYVQTLTSSSGLNQIINTKQIKIFCGFKNPTKSMVQYFAPHSTQLSHFRLVFVYHLQRPEPASNNNSLDPNHSPKCSSPVIIISNNNCLSPVIIISGLWSHISNQNSFFIR